MPSTPNDLAALVTSATPAGSNSLFKGIFAGLTNARSGTAESGSSAVADFESMLETPAAGTVMSDGAGNFTSILSVRNDRETLPVLADQTRCVLTAEMSVPASGTLQIKGMTSGLDQPVSSTVATMPQEISDLEESLIESAPVEFSPVVAPVPASIVVPAPIPATFVPVPATKLVSVDTIEPKSEDGLIQPVLIGDEAGLAKTNNSVPAANGTPSEPVKTGQGSAATVLSPAKGLRTHAMLHRPAGQHFTRTDSLLAAVKNHDCVVEKLPEVPDGQPAVTPITGELRRELIETVAALLAPLWSALPKILHPASSVAQDGTTNGEVALNGGGEKTLATAVTIKLGSRPPFTIELPFPDANLLDSNVTTRTPPTGPQASDESVAEQQPASSIFQFKTSARQAGVDVTVADQAPVNLSALDVVLAKILPMDFRIQLKTKIEAALEKVAPMPVDLSPETISAASEGETKNAFSDLAHRAGRFVFDGVKNVAPAVTERVLTFKTVAPGAAQPQQLPLKSETTATPVELLIEVPGFGSLTAQIVASQPATNLLEKKLAGRFGRAEKSAGDFKSAGLLGKEENIASEKTFLNPIDQSLKPKGSKDGTDVANSGDIMPAQFTSRRLSVDPLELPPRFNARGELLPALNESQKFAATTETHATPTPAPVLAHRAVETIMNVVDAQRHGSANASSVNLHFKFGGDDLAVRVQMRGGEVLAQFLTDSAELRSALSSEWQNMAGQGGAAGLRLLEPTILPASAGVSTGFGSASQGQNHTQQQQQAHQQQAQAAAAFPELRALRRGVANLAPVTESAPRVSITQPTSHHLTAIA